MNKLFLGTILIALLAMSCKKDKTSWNSSWNAPLVHGQLTLNDLVPPEYTTTNSGNYLSIVYNEKVFGISLDTLVELPDTSIVAKTAFALPLTINPAFVWIDSADQEWTIADIELKEIRAKEGDLTFMLTSEWNGNTTLTMDFPKVSLNGVPHYKSYDLLPGTLTNPSTEVDSIDMAGYTLDLTGISGNLYNTLSGDFIIESNEAVNTFDVNTSDSITYEIHFANIKVDYARGYFGQHTLTDTTGVSLPFMNSVLGGMIDIDSIDMTLKVMNGFNLVAQAQITHLEGINTKTNNNVALNFPQLGSSMNINPATGGQWGWNYSEYGIAINNSNSNITDFLENLSDSIVIGYDVQINPNGNISGGNDEIFPGSTLDLYVDGEFPVNFGASDLTLTDTFDFSYTGSDLYTGKGAQITISYTNGFPLEGSAKLYLLDNNEMVIDSLLPDVAIQSGIYNTGNYTTAPTAGNVIYSLTELNIMNLELADKMKMNVSFSTDAGQKVKIDANAMFDFLVKSNLQIDLHL